MKVLTFYDSCKSENNKVEYIEAYLSNYISAYVQHFRVIKYCTLVISKN